jgi:Subtilase family
MNPFTWIWGLVPRVSFSLPGSEARHRMGFVLPVAIYLLLGVALVTAAVWYTDAVWQRFFASDTTPAIAPIEIIGADEATTKSYKAGLPAMIVAATNELKSRTNIAIQALGDARAELAPLPRLPEHAELPVPSEFREPLAINLKIADVEVGSLLAFLFERSRDPNLVRLTVAVGVNGGASKVYGFVPGKSGYTFLAQAKSDLSNIAEAVAAQFVQRAAQRGESAFAELDPEDFLKTISGLETFARLTKRRRWILVGSDSSAGTQLRKDYAAVLDKVKDLAQRYTGWEGLQWLATQSAREARDWSSAVEFSGNLKRLAITGNDLELRGRVAQVAQEAERELAIEQAKLAARESNQPPAGVSAEGPSGPAVERIFTAVGLTKDAADAAGVTIGLVGPAPLELKDDSIEVLGGPTADADADPSLSHHQAIVHQVTRMLAPNAKFVYASFGISGTAASTDALIGALKQLIDRKPQIIFLAWGTSQPISAIDLLIKQFANKILFVLPAGNNPGPSNYHNVADVALVVAAVTPDGAPAVFTSASDNAIWAPGTDIPVIVTAADNSQTISGTSFSAAVGASAAAVLMGDFPTATPAQIRESLLLTSRPAQGRTQPPIINVSAAREWLRAKLGIRG